MKNCSSCGAENANDALFCGTCGAQIHEKAQKYRIFNYNSDYAIKNKAVTSLLRVWLCGCIAMIPPFVIAIIVGCMNMFPSGLGVLVTTTLIAMGVVILIAVKAAPYDAASRTSFVKDTTNNTIYMVRFVTQQYSGWDTGSRIAAAAANEQIKHRDSVQAKNGRLCIDAVEACQQESASRKKEKYMISNQIQITPMHEPEFLGTLDKCITVAYKSEKGKAKTIKIPRAYPDLENDLRYRKS